MDERINIAIKIGHTNSIISSHKDNKIQIITNKDGSECTPTVVYMDRNNKIHVGQYAKNRLLIEPVNTFDGFFNKLGNDAIFQFGRNGQKISSEELTREVICSLLSDASTNFREDIRASVFTFPINFRPYQINALKVAAEPVLLKLYPMISEPLAAAIAHFNTYELEGGYRIFYDLGGSSFSASIIKKTKGTIEIINHVYDNNIGGDFFDWEVVENLLVPYLTRTVQLTEFKRTNPHYRASFAILKRAAEEAKINLSDKGEFQITIDYLCLDDNDEPVVFDYRILDADFANVTRSYLRKTIDMIQMMLKDNRLGPAGIEEVVLLGGSTLSPWVREFLSDSIAGLGIDINFSNNPLTIVSQGAALYAGSLLLDAHPLSVETSVHKINYPFNSSSETKNGTNDTKSFSSEKLYARNRPKSKTIQPIEKIQDVFISYSFSNQEYTESVCKGLEKFGLSCWMAQRNLAPGVNWPEEITSNIKRSSTFIIILSNESNASGQIARELSIAEEFQLPIFCLRKDNISPSDTLKYYLANLQWIDSIDNPNDGAIYKLAIQIRSAIKSMSNL